MQLDLLLMDKHHLCQEHRHHLYLAKDIRCFQLDLLLLDSYHLYQQLRHRLYQDNLGIELNLVHLDKHRLYLKYHLCLYLYYQI